MNIYLDMDDVVADWITSAQEFLKMKWGDVERIPADDWKKLKNATRFYSTLPLKPGAIELVDYCRNLQIDGKIEQLAFLTALPHDYSIPYAAYDKVFWATNHFPNIPVFFGPFSHDKYRHCKPGDILIDDRTTNCIEWRDAGGKAFIYKNWEECKIWLDEIFQG